MNFFKVSVLIISLIISLSLSAQKPKTEIELDIINQTAVNLCSHNKQQMFAGMTTSYAGGNIDIKYHRMHWNIDPAVTYISGSVYTLFKVTENNTHIITFELDAAMQVDSVLYHGQNISFADSAAALLNLYLPSAISNNTLDSVEIFYQGVPGAGLGFGSFLQDYHNGAPIIWTLSEPYGAKEWWPNKNDLSDKIDSIDVYVKTPMGQRAASNGLLVEETVVDNHKLYHWKHRHAIATYLVAIAVTNYAVYSDFATINSGVVEVLNYIYPEDSATVVTQTPNVVSSIQLYSNLFIDYPFIDEKYGHAQFGWGGGMEHQTMSFMGGFSHALMAHELAHQWFGDMVTCGSWHDIWLNEGFATYLTGLTYEHMPGTPWWESWRHQTMNNVINYPDGSVYCDDTTSVNRIFNSRLSYNKGAYVLHMLRWVCGDSAFFAGIRNYLNDPALSYGYAHTSDLKAHLETASGLNLTEFFDDWYYGQGYPIYNISVYQSNLDSITVTLNQSSSHFSVNFFEMPVPIRIKGNNFDSTIVFDNTFSGQQYSVAVNSWIDTVEFDPEIHLISRSNISSNIGISNHNTDNELFIAPNPTKNTILIKSKDIINNIDLFDVSGRKIKSFNGLNVNDYTINLTNNVTGIYLLRISTSQQTFVKKVVKD
ncbi:MAG: peptidase M1 [Bacteroidetes bacterium]|nr:MAG: peptidase M1 [Bacteroidota bacterium]